MTGEVTHGRTSDGRKVAITVTRREHRATLSVAVDSPVVLVVTMASNAALDLAGHLADAASRYGGQQR